MNLYAKVLHGSYFELPAPISLECARAYDVPADGLDAVFPADALEALGELTELRLLLDGELIFDGLVDEQVLTRDAAGVRLTLRARSRAALLLDNEAIPQTFQHVSLRDIYNAHCRQYGFAGILYERNPTLSSFTVAKGQSEWQALENFCRQTLELIPHVEGQYIAARPRKPARRLTLSNITADGLRYSSFQLSNRRYGVISKVILKSDTKLYDTPVYNPQGEALGIRRKRYVSPPREWVNPRRSADRMMRDSMLKKRTVTAVLPGLIPAGPGDTAELADLVGLGRLIVYEATHRANGAKQSTTLLLVQDDYLS